MGRGWVIVKYASEVNYQQISYMYVCTKAVFFIVLLQVNEIESHC